MTVHWSTRAKLSPLFRHRPLPLSIYSFIPLILSSSSRWSLSLSRDWLLFSSISTFLFHSGYLPLPGHWFLSFPGCRSRRLSISFLPFLQDGFFFHWDGHRSLSLQHFDMSGFLQSLIFLRLYKLTVCVTTALSFAQASQNASPVTGQGDAHPLQMICSEIAALV